MNSPHNPLDQWEWIYAFMRGVLEMDEGKAAKIANHATGETRPEPEEDAIVAKLKPFMQEAHDLVCDCANAQSHRSEISRAE